MMTLSPGVVKSHLLLGKLPPPGQTVFKVLGVRVIAPNSKYRVALTDTDDADNPPKFTKAMIVLQPGDDPASVPLKNQYIDVANDIGDGRPENAFLNNDQMDVFLIHRFKVISSVTPKKPTSSTPSTPSSAIIGSDVFTPGTPPTAPHKRSAAAALLGTPATPSTSTGGPASAFRAADSSGVKRSLLFKDDDGAAGAGNSNSRATHLVKDLNPYQNKFTILARLSYKAALRHVSTSRWEGTILNVTFEDESGDIQAVAFNDHAKKFDEALKEGQAYYLTNAKVKSIRQPQYNRTKHNYELELNQHTLLNECRKQNNLPGLHFNFVPLADISDKADGDVVDVIGYCVSANSLVEGTSRAGKPYKKRDITLADDSNGGSDIVLTLWREKAELFVGVDKVLVVKGATVSTWNGKALSQGFTSQLMEEPDLPETRRLRDWHESGAYKSSSSQGRVGAGPGDDSAPDMSLGEIKLAFRQNDIAEKASYYNATVNSVKFRTEGTWFYKSCPTDDCRKKVVQQEGSQSEYRCPSCNKTSTSARPRYILGLLLADATDYQWAVAFDEAAADILGCSAPDLADKYENNASEFERVIRDGQFQLLRCRLKCTMETYQGENRLKVVVVKVTKVERDENYVEQLQKAVGGLRKELGMVET